MSETTAWDRIDKKLDALVEATRVTDKPGWPIQVHLWLPPVFGMVVVAAILVWRFH